MSDTAPEQESPSFVPSKKRPSSTIDKVANKRSAFQITRESRKIVNLSRSSSIPSDVEIDVLGDVYHLHSSILCNASKFFDCSLSKVWYRPENAHAGEDGIKFRYSLALAAEDDYVGCFEPIPVCLAAALMARALITQKLTDVHSLQPERHPMLRTRSSAPHLSHLLLLEAPKTIHQIRRQARRI